MLYLKIKNKWEEVELNNENEVISLNYNLNSLTNPTLYQAEYSYNINIERTPKNDKLFENVFRLDSVLQDFSTNTKLEFMYIIDNQIVSNGSTALIAINDTHYTFALNGSLTNIFLKALNSGWADNPNPNDFDYYQIEDDILEGNLLTPQLVKASFEDDDYLFSFNDFTNIEDITKRFTQTAGFIPVNFNEYSNFDKTKWKIGNNIAGLFKVSDSVELNLDFSDDEINESVMCEYRCYEQQPYIYVSRLYQLYQKYFRQITGYDLVLDSRWFNSNYNYLNKLIYVLPKLDTESVVNTNQYAEEFENYFTNPFNTVLTYNKTITSTNTVTCSGANKAIFEWTIPFEWRVSLQNEDRTKFFNPKYAVKLTAKVKNDNNTYITKTYIYLPVVNDTDEDGNYTTQTAEWYKQNWRNAGYEIIEYVYDTEQREEDGFIICRFGFLNGKIIADNLEDAYLELNLSFVSNPQFQTIVSNQPVFNLSADFFTCILNTEALIDTSLQLSNSYNSDINLKRLFGDIKPFSILLKHSKLNGLNWIVDESNKEITLIRRADFFHDCFTEQTNPQKFNRKLSTTHPYKKLFDITNITDLTNYKIIPMDWNTRDLTLNYDVGNEQYGKAYQDKYGMTFGSKLIHTQNKLNQDNTDLFCTNEYDRINPPIFSAEYYRSFYNIRNNISKKTQLENLLCAVDNCFCFRLENSTYDNSTRNEYRVDSGNAYVLISGDTDNEVFNNLYCWHYQKETVDEITTVRPVFSECNENNYTLLFAEPYEYYSKSFPTKNNVKYLYDEQMNDYFQELYNVNNKTLECSVYMNSELFIRLKHNPFITVGNVAYIICEIFDWKGEGFTKCKLKQISKIERLFKKSSIKNKININLNPTPIYPTPPAPDTPTEPEEPIEPELPEVAENEDILVIENVDTTEGTVLMRNPNSIAIQYSTNGSEFNEYTTETEIPIKPSDKVYFKWSEVIGNSSNETALVHSSVKYNVSGELKKGNNEYAYCSMFDYESNLVDASELKLTATTLNKCCYMFMFKGCKALTTAPELPATQLADECYNHIFCYCSSLVQAPALPATELMSGCYISMFYGCSSLVEAPLLPATNLESYCYQNMFYGCKALNYIKHNITTWNTTYTYNWLSGVSSSGVVECPANSTIKTDSASGVPKGWTRVNF